MSQANEAANKPAWIATSAKQLSTSLLLQGGVPAGP